jgi:hypothetical protein
MIESRVNWFLDLLLVNYESLCNSGRICPLDLWMGLENSLARDGTVSPRSIEDFYEGYVSEKHGIKFSMRMNGITS